jgi:hypothetical protein
MHAIVLEALVEEIILVPIVVLAVMFEWLHAWGS